MVQQNSELGGNGESVAVPARAIGFVWLVAGASLMAWAGLGLYRWSQSIERFSSRRDAALIFLVFAMVAVVGGLLAVLRRRAGRPVLVVASWLSLVYSASYFLMGGIDDTSKLYLVAVLVAAVLSVTTLILRRRLAV